MNLNIIPEPIEFDWDKGNIDKNLKKHGITNQESEEIFISQPVIFEDAKHSKLEKRYQCLGRSDNKKNLFASFTIRNGKIRIISIRSMDKKERKIYEQEIQKNT